MQNLRWMVLNAAVAALYAGLTIGLAPISYGAVQVRLSECMTLLAFYNKKFIPGLVLGCFLANLGSPFGLVDIVVGTLATFVAVYLMRYCANIMVASFMPVIANGIIIALELAYLAEVPLDISLLGVMFYIGIGEFIAVSVIGIIIMRLLLKNNTLQNYILEMDKNITIKNAK